VLSAAVLVLSAAVLVLSAAVLVLDPERFPKKSTLIPVLTAQTVGICFISLYGLNSTLARIEHRA
jgi:hypothetical protein